MQASSASASSDRRATNPPPRQWRCKSAAVLYGNGTLNGFAIRQTKVLFIDDKAAADEKAGLAVERLYRPPARNTHPVLMQRQVVGAEIQRTYRPEIYLMLPIASSKRPWAFANPG